MAGGGEGFALGVDLGTSNTVAVLRWPDGRTRPLLFDGLPVMPSGVHLDEHGRLHAGRDAQRLAEADPGRYEPNPKRRVDEASVLLGDREVPVVDLLAAILTAVARAAVEAAGFLPPAVLTYPAAWGARRRDVLAAAAARAGWPQPHLVPEPVAAARYFADVLRRPVPVAASLAVFDFGGGTLDIAVVRNEGGRFAVLGSGGVDELGGLDLDHVLVDHLGRVLSRTSPEAWQRLAAPRSATDQRDRRRFWEAVRGAKEMLSRTSSAPVAVPGVDQAAHLTREELESVVQPLLRRGVYEAAAVIGRCGLRPAELAGLFLVGGSSRVPLVARMLHAELGIAPTVLEQPELPVAEGALAELAGPAPAPAAAVARVPVQAVPAAAVAAPVAAAAAPVSPGAGPAAPVSPVPAPVTEMPTGVGVRGRPYRWKWIAAGAAAAVLLVTGGVYWFSRDRYPEISFNSGTAKVAAFPMGDGVTSSSAAFTHVMGDTGYLAWQAEERLEVVAADLTTGKERWRKPVNGTSQYWEGVTGLPGVVVVSAYEYSTTQPRTMYVLDAGSGRELWHRDFYGNDTRLYFDGVMVLADKKEARLRGLDLRTGQEKWSHDFPKDQYGYTTASVYPAITSRDVSGAASFGGNALVPDRGDDQRIVLIGVDEKAYVYDAGSGKLRKDRGNVGKPDWWYLVYDGTLYVAPDDAGYRIEAYDLDAMGEPRRVYTTTDSKRSLVDLAACGDHLCLLDEAGSDDKTIQVVAASGGRELWRRDAANGAQVVPLGDRVLVTRTSGTVFSVVFDADGGTVYRREMVGARLNTGSVLLFSDAPSSYAADTNLAGLGARSKRITELGELADVRGQSCSWSSSLLVCATDKQFVVWRFAG